MSDWLSGIPRQVQAFNELKRSEYADIIVLLETLNEENVIETIGIRMEATFKTKLLKPAIDRFYKDKFNELNNVLRTSGLGDADYKEAYKIHALISSEYKKLYQDLLLF